MQGFETFLALLLGASALSLLARQFAIPYPSLLAAGGAILSLVPGAPRVDLSPDLILALFVAPVLLDAAYDASFRDLRRNWLSVLSLVLVAVAVTTIAVAWTARLLFPAMPWPAAVVLGALVAPPDAVAALAVLREVEPPYRVRVVLEGESLLNDASALLIYRLGVAAIVAGGFDPLQVAPTFAVVVVGSVVIGWLLAAPVHRFISKVNDAPTSVIFQFGVTFGIWLMAEHLGLSGVVTVVVFGLTMGQRSASPLSPHVRVQSFAIWAAATTVLNVLAFALIGLRLSAILEHLQAAERVQYFTGAAAVLGVVIAVRMAWVMAHHHLATLGQLVGAALSKTSRAAVPNIKEAAVVGWSGMRGIVTLAAAMALPTEFPYRDFIELTAFVVVVGTLLVQGLTLRPLLRLLRLPKDDTVAAELAMARKAAREAGLLAVSGCETREAERLAEEYASLEPSSLPGDAVRPDAQLRRRAVAASRVAIQDLRRSGAIGDEAFRRCEEELDWVELSASVGDLR